VFDALRSESVYFFHTVQRGIPQSELAEPTNIGVQVLGPDGKHLGLIVPPEFAPGFTFGDADGKTLYLAASSQLARIRVNNAGAR